MNARGAGVGTGNPGADPEVRTVVSALRTCRMGRAVASWNDEQHAELVPLRIAAPALRQRGLQRARRRDPAVPADRAARLARRARRLRRRARRAISASVTPPRSCCPAGGSCTTSGRSSPRARAAPPRSRRRSSPSRCAADSSTRESTPTPTDRSKATRRSSSNRQVRTGRRPPNGTAGAGRCWASDDEAVEEALDSILDARTPLLQRAFRNARRVDAARCGLDPDLAKAAPPAPGCRLARPLRGAAGTPSAAARRAGRRDHARTRPSRCRSRRSPRRRSRRSWRARLRGRRPTARCA